MLSKFADFCDSNCAFGWKTADQDDSYRFTAPVGSYKPNGLGLYNMTGNVWQWLNDWYDNNYYRDGLRSNPKGPSTGEKRVLRGGSWGDNPAIVRVAKRVRHNPDYQDDGSGFRLAVSPQ